MFDTLTEASSQTLKKEIVPVAKISGNWLVGILAELSRDATPLTEPLQVLGTTDERSKSPYSSDVPVPFTRTYCEAFDATNVGRELSGEVSNH